MNKRQSKWEFECQRRNVTPREFWRYCIEQAKKRVGESATAYFDFDRGFDEWAEPTQNIEGHEIKHEDWEVPCREFNKFLPFELQMFVSNSFNFILEFDFNDENRGNGYCYITEYVEKTKNNA